MPHSSANPQTRKTARPSRPPVALCASALLAMALAATQTACGGLMYKEFSIDPQTGYYSDPGAKAREPAVAETIVDEELGINPKTARLVVPDEPREGTNLFGEQFTLRSVEQMGFFGEALTTTEYRETILGQDLRAEIDARHEKQIEEASKEWKAMSKTARKAAEKRFRQKLKLKKSADLEEIRSKPVSAEEYSRWAREGGNFLWLRWSFPGGPTEYTVDEDGKRISEEEAKKLMTRLKREGAVADCRRITSPKRRRQCIDDLPGTFKTITAQKMHLALIDAASQRPYFIAEKVFGWNDSGLVCYSDGSLISEAVATGCRNNMQKSLTLLPGFHHAYVPRIDRHLYPLLNALIEYMRKRTKTSAVPVAAGPRDDRPLTP